MPPCGTWTTTDVPDAKLDQVLAEISLNNPINVSQTQQPNGAWTVVATYPPCPDGQPQTTTTSHGG